MAITIKIAPMEQKHIKDICEVENSSFSVPWSEESFVRELSNDLATYFVALYGEKAVGYGGMWSIAGEGQITNIAVLKEYRKNNIGTRLLDALIKSAIDKKLSVLMLEVRKSNIPALSLYKKAGFEIVGERTNYYKNPTENAILMNKEINLCP